MGPKTNASCIIVRIMKAKLVLIFIAIIFSGCGLGPDMTRDRIPRSPSPTPWQGEKSLEENLRDGDAAFAAKDYPAAIKSYRPAFDREQGKPTLEKKQWYKLLENFAHSYTLAGDTKNARVILAHGISKDYDYPMFHYNLARTFGQEGLEAEAISHLRRAYQRRKKMPAGETLPDPLIDESFAGFADSEMFKKAVADMKRGNLPPLE